MWSDIFTLVSSSEDGFCIELASKEHEVFKAHFKNNPMLPGFIFFEICSSVLNHEILSIKKAKFLKPVRPCERLTFLVKSLNEKISVKVENKKTKVAEFVYEKK